MNLPPELLDPQTITAIGGATVATLGCIFAFFKWLLPWSTKSYNNYRRERDDKLTEDALKDFHEMCNEMHALKNIGYERVIIFTGHNTGGIPQPGAPFYASAIHWDVDNEDRNYPARYQNLPLDAACIRALMNVRDQGVVRVTPDNIEGLTKQLYLIEGVKDSLWINLGIKDRKFYFMSVGMYSDTPITELLQTEALVHANNISLLINKDHDR